jgi:hypothetical protein
MVGADLAPRVRLADPILVDRGALSDFHPVAATRATQSSADAATASEDLQRRLVRRAP